jgi:hypothetical protein
MKNIRLFTFVLIIATLVLSACGAPAATPAAPEATVSVKAIAMPVAFIGIVESIKGDQWVISGTTVTVDPAIVRDGPYTVGDRVKVEGFTSSDGSLTLSRVEAPRAQETATSDDNSNDANTNDDNSNTANTNDDNGGSVNSNDDNSNTASTNDDNGGSSVNSNDDNSNTTSSNDGSNVNEDNGNGGNTNDDHGGSNSNDDKSGSGGNNDNSNSGKDDNGSGG